LFSPNPYGILKVLHSPGQGHTLTLEYTPYEQIAQTVVFNLPAAIPSQFEFTPSEKQEMAVAAKARAAEKAKQDEIASLRHQYYSCILDKSRSGTECGTIAKTLLDRYGVDVNQNH
jgi:hypothetical protein